MPHGFCLAAANEPERNVAAALLERMRGECKLHGSELVIGDRGFAGHAFEQIVAALAAGLLPPDRSDGRPRLGSLGAVRRWIESIINTAKGQLSLERHGGRTLDGSWHNGRTGDTGFNFTAYGH
jgi:hypothetical protein